MREQPRPARRSVRGLIAVVVIGAIVSVGAGSSVVLASVGTGATGAAAAASPPLWCQWIPPQFWPPECHPTPPPTTTTTAPPASTTTTAPPPTTTTTTPTPGGNVEAHFAAAGPSPVTTGSATDGSGNAFTLFYPTNVATDGIDNPILTWGNGTGSTPSNYQATLTHAASWGFVVVASNSGQTGWGTEMWAGAQYMIGRDSDPSSVFHQQLDTTKIGAFGHSQGATGAVRSTILSNGAITSTVPVNFVDPAFFNPASQMPDWSQVDDPIFFVSGGSDFLSSQGQQTAYYNGVNAPAARAAVVGGDHNVIQQSGNRMLGYVTAWFTYTLRGDIFARGAFVGSPPQINANSAWTNQAEKNRP